MTLFSVLPDTPLIFNEILLIKNKQRFDPWKVPAYVMICYKTTHSLFFLFIIYWLFGYHATIAFGVHQITDWFTHTGRFAAVPLFPYKYKIKFGREILK